MNIWFVWAAGGVVFLLIVWATKPDRVQKVLRIHDRHEEDIKRRDDSNWGRQ